ncbi:SDR family NAD(P)-dependent oxidoreductase [Domibacillus robiginosus]|uniref:SDR family NAD(P)-dependent oxidoreductase n=1 Tax=Domibacillus robiginosus TaxID=1071054 RepID=UPI000A7609D0|nr:SDR family NAD(P)-dependent oxidoreductase [Domibacillus robiginosus]
MGMGLATAKLFAEAKAKVVIADFNEEKGKAAASEIEADGGEAYFIKVDISKSDQVQNMVAKTVEKYGRLDVGSY